MSLPFKSAGIKTVGPSPTPGFVADPDPNTTPPAADRILQLPDRTANGALSRGARGYVDFRGTIASGTPSVDFVPWVLDETAQKWSTLLPQSGLVDKDFFTIEAVAPARLFFQFTNMSGGDATQAEVRAAPF